MTRLQAKKPTDGRGRLIEDEELALAHDRTRQRENLALANRQVAASARDLGVERDAALVRLALQREQACGAEGVIQDGVVVLREGVEVLPERAAEQLWNLWDDGDVRAERIQVDRVGGDAVVVHLALGEDQAEERERQRTLAAAGATD